MTRWLPTVAGGLAVLLVGGIGATPSAQAAQPPRESAASTVERSEATPSRGDARTLASSPTRRGCGKVRSGAATLSSDARNATDGSAERKRRWRFWHRGKVRGSACYRDGMNAMFVEDLRKDGHSVVFVVWKKGAYKKRERFWHHWGSDIGPVGFVPNKRREGARMRFRLCLGEYDTRDIWGCGKVRHYRR